MKEFEVGEEVVAVKGQFKGLYGVVTEYNILDLIVIKLGEGQGENELWAIPADDLEPLPVEEPYGDAAEEQIDEVPVYDFGIPAHVLERHLQWFVGRSLERLGEVGPAEALFGFQEFEGKAPHEVILELMGKLEEGTALLAQTHILLGRIVMALESVHDQNE